MTSPDLNDPEIRALLDRNHVPEEVAFQTPSQTQVEIICEKCREPYPCPTRQALRDREMDLKRRQTSYEIVDCDNVPNKSHKAHAWMFRGADFWCPGG